MEESAQAIADLVLAACRDAYESVADLQQEMMSPLAGAFGGAAPLGGAFADYDDDDEDDDADEASATPQHGQQGITGGTATGTGTGTAGSGVASGGTGTGTGAPAAGSAAASGDQRPAPSDGS